MSSLPVPRSQFDAAIKALDNSAEHIRELAENLARELPDYARVERQLFEWGASGEACERFAAIVGFAKRLQVMAVKTRVATLEASKAMRACDPELTPVRSPSQAVMQAVQAAEHFSNAGKAMKK